MSGTTFEWPNVVFNSPDAAGNAVAAALQAATCTFTVAPTEPPTTPAPPAAPGAPRDIRLTPGDGFIDMAWSPPAEGADAVTDYRARCTSDDGTIESAEGVSTQPGARVEGLEQGREYRCEVATVTAAGDGDWVAAPELPARSGSRFRRPYRASSRPTARSRSASSPRPASRSIATNAPRTGAPRGRSRLAITSASTTARIRDLANGTRVRLQGVRRE